MLTHKRPHGVYDFILLNTDSGAGLTVPEGHYIFVEGRGMAGAGTISVGDRLQVAATMETTAVTGVTCVRR